MKYTTSFATITAALALSASLANAQLLHRYSFNSDASDSVGSANGTMLGNAAVGVGQLQLDGTTGTAVALDSAAIAVNTYSALTLEVWATAYSPLNTGFHSLLGFGKTNSFNAGFAGDYVLLQTHRGDNVSRASISIDDDDTPWLSETGANGPELNDGAEHYYAAVVTATDISLFIDGVLAQTTPNSQSLADVSDQFALIGAAYPQDPTWAGYVNELRIYGNAVPAFAIADNYAAGPDGVVVVPEPATLALTGFGLLGLLMLRRKSNS